MSRLGAIFVAALMLFYVAACDSGPRRHATAIKPPGCSSAVASAPAARTAVRQTTLPGRPFGVVPVGDGIHALVSLSGSGAPVLAVLNIAGRIPTVQRTIMLPVGTFGAGLAISHNR